MDKLVTIRLANKALDERLKTVLRGCKAGDYMVVPGLMEVGTTASHYLYYSPFFCRIHVVRKDLMVGKKYVDDEALRYAMVTDSLLVPSDFEGSKALMRYKEGYTDTLSKITINLSLHCNLRCKYCYAKAKGSSKTIDMNFCEKAILYVLKGDPNDLLISFMGGEPTLHFDLIKKIVKYAERRHKSVQYYLTTNGTLPRKQMDYYGKHKFRVQLSFDGPPEIQNMNRPTVNGAPTNQYIEKNLPYFMKICAPLGVRSTLSNFSVIKQKEIAYYYHTLGITYANFMPARNVNDRSRRGGSVDMTTFYINLLEAKEVADDFGMVIDTLDLRITQTMEFICQPNLCLTPDGLISYCFEAVTKKEGNKSFFYGKYDKKVGEILIDEGKYKGLVRASESLPASCESCFLKWSCYGGCPMDRLFKSGSLYKQNLLECEHHRQLVRDYIKYKVEKDILQIKPYLALAGGEIYFQMNFNTLRLSTSAESVGHLFLEVYPDTGNLAQLSRDLAIIQSKRKYDPTLFIISLRFLPDSDVKSWKDEVKSFIEGLEKHKLWFRLARPLPACISLDNSILENHKIPTNCRDCLELFYVKDNRIHFCNGGEGRLLSEYLDREEIYRDFLASTGSSDSESSEISYPHCRFCVKSARNECQTVRCGWSLSEHYLNSNWISIRPLDNFFQMISAGMRLTPGILQEYYLSFGWFGFQEPSNATLLQNMQFVSEITPVERTMLHLFRYRLLPESNLVKMFVGMKNEIKKNTDLEFRVEPRLTFIVDTLHPETDARLQKGGNITINFYYYYLLSLDGWNNEKIRIKLIGSIRHELAHLLMEAISPARDVSLAELLFREGFATFFEAYHTVYHRRYMREISKWTHYLSKIALTKEQTQLRQVVRDILEDKTLQRDFIKEISLTNDLTDKQRIESIFIHRNGPIYHIGFMIWESILRHEKKHNLTKIIAEGPEKFLERYNRILQSEGSRKDPLPTSELMRFVI